MRGFYSDSENTAAIGIEKADKYLSEGLTDNTSNL
jgi:hypothetical protein